MQHQLPCELFHLFWHERKLYWPEARDHSQSQGDSSATLPKILLDMAESPVLDDDRVMVFREGAAAQELALQNEACYSVSVFVRSPLSVVCFLCFLIPLR